MLEVILKRAWSDHRATLGMLTIKGIQHDPFFTLENPDRGEVSDSCIPAGFYNCLPYSGLKWQDVYQVMDVPNRTAILFHSGNFETETTGCILIGLGAEMMEKEPIITHSKIALRRFRELIGGNIFRLTIC